MFSLRGRRDKADARRVDVSPQRDLAVQLSEAHSPAPGGGEGQTLLEGCPGLRRPGRVGPGGLLPHPPPHRGGGGQDRVRGLRGVPPDAVLLGAPWPGSDQPDQAEEREGVPGEKSERSKNLSNIFEEISLWEVSIFITWSLGLKE